MPKLKVPLIISLKNIIIKIYFLTQIFHKAASQYMIIWQKSISYLLLVFFDKCQLIYDCILNLLALKTYIARLTQIIISHLIIIIIIIIQLYNTIKMLEIFKFHLLRRHDNHHIISYNTIKMLKNSKCQPLRRHDKWKFFLGWKITT